ncbi:hypothetical protein Gasu2_23490 [Galdieria sulphuraria]|nr:hypothetical protein Gasu2_23490 [Galdieria sulphuraria]
MKASEWIQLVERLVKEDKNVINKPVKLFGSCLVSLNRDYYLVLLSQNVCYLLGHKQDSFPRAVEVQWSKSLSFEATAIRLHPNGNLGALVEAFPSKNLIVKDVCWHPSSTSHLCLLTSDNTLWFWNVLSDVEEEEQRLSIKLPDSSNVVSFCFGIGPGWEFFTAYVTSSKGEIYYLCPVYPFGCYIPLQLLNSLRQHVEARYNFSFEGKGPTSQKLTFSTRENKSIDSWTKHSFDSKGLGTSDNTIWMESTRLQHLFLEECWMACEMNDNIKTQRDHRNSSLSLSLGRTISRWEPSIQGPIVIQKDNKSSFYKGEDYCLFLVMFAFIYN